MKRSTLVLSLFAVFLFAASAWAVDKAAISKNVDAIATGIDSGQDVMSFKADAYDPYAFVMEEGGKLLVHPTLAGKNLKEEAPPAYEALMQASPAGVWVKYQWKGKEKNTYAKRTTNNLIVGSGY